MAETHAHTVALLRIELRRQLPLAFRLACAAAVMIVLFYLSGKRAAADYLGALFGAGLGISILVPIGLMRDRMEGRLEFLCGLPIEPRAIALSRLAAATLIALPCAAVIGVAVASLPANATPNPAAVSGLAWLGFTLVATCMTAAMARYDIAQMMGAPMIGTMVLFFLAPRIARRIAPGLSGDSIVRFLQRPAGPVLAAGILIVLLLALGIAALAVTEHALATYSHDSSST